MATDDPRRTRAGGGPGRTLGDGSDIQRGWLNPDHQLFGQVTSRVRHHRLYDRSFRCLTNTEEPSCGARRATVVRSTHKPTVVRSTHKPTVVRSTHKPTVVRSTHKPT